MAASKPIKMTKVDASKVPSGPTPMHFNLKLGRDVLKSPFGNKKA